LAESVVKIPLALAISAWYIEPTLIGACEKRLEETKTTNKKSATVRSLFKEGERCSGVLTNDHSCPGCAKRSYASVGAREATGLAAVHQLLIAYCPPKTKNQPSVPGWFLVRSLFASR
jgi:hypothetical protein